MQRSHTILNRALKNEHQRFNKAYSIADEAAQLIINAADSDARRLLNSLELAVQLTAANEQENISASTVEEVIKDGVRRFDNHGEDFYNQISALHKSVRGSDHDASIYWLRRMLDGGCDPLYVARRLVRIASEDIGNADPRALQIALSAWETQEELGSPEGELALAQAIAYLACAAKSNAVYNAYNSVGAVIKKTGSLDVPYHLRNAPTKLMEQEGYHKGYRYAHNEPDAFAAGETYLPEKLIGQVFYEPVKRGLEIKISDKLNHLRELNKRAKQDT